MSPGAPIRVAVGRFDSEPRVRRLFDAWAGDEERERHSRLKRAADRAEYAAAHVLLRYMLAEATTIPPDRLRFEREINGKPMLASGPGLHFSVSHSGGWAMVAISAGCPVGVDLEATGLSADPSALVASIAAPPERAFLEALGSPSRLGRELLRLWVIKEAALKMTGEGLSCDPALLSAAPATGGVVEVIDLRRPAPAPIATARSLDLGPAGPAAIAVPPGHAGSLSRIEIRNDVAIG